MKLIKYPEKETWTELVKRPVKDFKKIEEIVLPILKKVRKKGDKALRKFALEYDHVTLKEIMVTQKEIEEAKKLVGQDLKQAINIARENIEKFHQSQKEAVIEVETTPGVVCMRKSVPIEKIGLYIPGGTAPLFSTVLMLGIPANIAGCKEIIITTPTDHSGKVNPVILYVADLLGIDKIAKVGGAQAIAALAYGTESIPQVYKIFGPGNQYVTAAKQLVSQQGVSIDMPAGPSELAVFADESAIPSFVASDLLSQAEHGVDSQVVLVSTSKGVIDEVMKEIEKQIADLPRKFIAEKALDNSLAILFEEREVALAFLNAYAAEHLILALSDAEAVAEKVTNAGSVFIGNFTPESAGDYASGTNHTLPTNGFARAFSGVSLDSFVKKITFQKISREGIQALGPAIEKLADAEQLQAHCRAVSVRLKYIKDNV